MSNHPMSCAKSNYPRKAELDWEQIESINDRIRKMDPGETGIFLDGAIDRDSYEASGLRVLWLLKEAVGDYVAEEYNKELIVKNAKDGTICRTLEMVAYVSFALINGLHKWEDIPDLYGDTGSWTALLQVGIVNARKQMGGTTSSMSQVYASFWENEALILEQITAYRPDVVIMGYPNSAESMFNRVSEAILGKARSSEIVGDCRMETNGTSVAMWVYHPGKWGGRESYCEDILAAFNRSLELRRSAPT